jgi:hypothetical protein
MTYKQARFVTKFASVAEAEAAKKKLDIYDKEFKVGMSQKWDGYVPQFMREKFQRARATFGVRWEIVLLGDSACFLFVPCDTFKIALSARDNFMWMRLAVDVSKEMTEILGYYVPFFLE